MNKRLKKKKQKLNSCSDCVCQDCRNTMWDGGCKDCFHCEYCIDFALKKQTRFYSIFGFMACRI